MTSMNFRGFGNATIKGETVGDADDPTVLLLHGGGRTQEAWTDVARALVTAGRQVISIDLRGPEFIESPGTRRLTFDELVEGLRYVLSQLSSRPTIVATSVGGWVACAALGESRAPVASGLVICDAPPNFDRDPQEEAGNGGFDWDPSYEITFDVSDMRTRLEAAASNVTVPLMFVASRHADRAEDVCLSFHQTAPNLEVVEIATAEYLNPAERLDLFNAVLLNFLEQKDPRTPPDYIAGSDSRTLRNAMGCFATGITIITALRSDSTPIGLTANSFTSVSLDPPLLLVCIAKSSSNLVTFEQTDSFAVNVLHIGQQPTSNLFTSKSGDRFSHVEWRVGESGAPILPKSLASIECSTHARYDGGDHIILVGKVERATFDPRRDPLLYFSGKYRRLHLG
ncbi:alpha/beta fold hydrolase [Agrobacterium vitis]|uniref:Alpha/beta fold hydrolase n=1 Tax=Agrobacterium vitis TaxID=373 RepID=A0AAE4X064_AGRVI|nr:alpha/beta fold hydrolase [Agrobacterium vitis]MBF2714129.1 alpha/beta fold hydrolase [Agrobacterium vitis]MUO81508.1 alpha/beta fold hydrolase [Agrobacterium vitis]MUO95845.1 alpha/beta fold hydrolase [Agrobacterium vitis]MVA93924.1 alpha/beta fold hydrolase [Agrobacterium vitis]MVB03569.1 alpha/beta fold hydrolase [Agrobacterium vitis]